jgi:hypothetical protein
VPVRWVRSLTGSAERLPARASESIKPAGRTQSRKRTARGR